jgi:hypothetical protein
MDIGWRIKHDPHSGGKKEWEEKTGIGQRKTFRTPESSQNYRH